MATENLSSFVMERSAYPRTTTAEALRRSHMNLKLAAGSNASHDVRTESSGQIDEDAAQPASAPADANDQRRPARRARTVRQASVNDAMGDALRSVYQVTVQESVPDEFLDLLGKLD